MPEDLKPTTTDEREIDHWGTLLCINRLDVKLFIRRLIEDIKRLEEKLSFEINARHADKVDANEK